LIDACTGDGLVIAILTPKLRRLAWVANRKRQSSTKPLGLEPAKRQI